MGPRSDKEAVTPVGKLKRPLAEGDIKPKSLPGRFDVDGNNLGPIMDPFPIRRL
jgi:hypothetical protein